MITLHSRLFLLPRTSNITTISRRLSLIPKPNSLISLKPLFSTNPNFNSTMSSSRPSAFDALMSKARAAGKKKPQSEASPTKKRKTQESVSPKVVGNASSDDAHQVFDRKPKRENVVEFVESEGTEVLANGCKDGKVNLGLDEKSAVKKVGAVGLDEKSAVKKVGAVSLDESIVQLKKAAASFDPKKAAFWGEGEKVPFSFVARVFDAIDKESGRIAITEIVCNMLRTVIQTSPDDLVPVVYLLANRIAPAHEGLELGIGDASIIKALAEACGCKEAQIKKQYKDLGDLGLVAKASRSSQSLMRKPEALTVTKVFNTFQLIAKESGKDSQEKKKNHIKALLVAATDFEPLYMIRLLQTKLRIGLAEQTLLAALGHAAYYSEKRFKPPANIDSPLEEAAKIVKQVYSVIPVYDKIIPAILTGGVWDLPKTCSFSPGVPVGPMLAKPTKGVSEILDKF